MSKVSTNYNKNTERFESSYTVVGIKSLSKYIHQSLIRPAHNVLFFFTNITNTENGDISPMFLFFIFLFSKVT